MTRCLLVTHDGASISRGQIYPFFRYRDELARQFQFEFDSIPHGNADLADRLRALRPDVVAVQGRQNSLDDAGQLLDLVRGGSPQARIVWMDVVDSTYARQFRLLPRVDLYIKGHLLADRALYRNSYLDGRIFADYMIRREQLPSEFRGTAYDDERQLTKVMLGWNYGASDIFERPFAAQDYLPYRNDRREWDICCRVRTQWPVPRAWYARQRKMAIEALAPLAAHRRVVATDKRIPREDYIAEMRNSRITVSPFGWGEICGRDFEAVHSGSLLVKPSMDHVVTRPDIYQDGRTYVSVKWDFSDLAEKCEYYLRRPAERETIVKEAARCYARYFQENEFLRIVEEMMQRLNA